MAEGFLGRWAKRKEAVRKGEEVPKEPEVVEKPLPSPQPSPASGPGSEAAMAPAHRGGEGAAPEAPPTLADAEALTAESDFTRFVRPDVDPQVKNAAMKKLFADPHFNKMDGLDTYIDDYGKPDPIPPAMLRQMVGARFLKLFDDEDEKEGRIDPTAGKAADGLPAETVAQSDSRTEQASTPADDHADPDLRLQQDDAPGPQGPGQRSR